MLSRYSKNKFFWLAVVLVAEILLLGLFHNAYAISTGRLAANNDLIFTLQIPIAGTTQIVINGSAIGNYINTFYLWAIRAVTVLAVFMIMLAGIRWITANGNASTIGLAKAQLTDAIIGLILILFANVMLYMINPALVRFKSLTIPKIEKVKLSVASNVIENLDILMQPDEWYEPNIQPGPTSNICGTLSPADQNGKKFYGVNCQNWNVAFADQRRPCFLKFSITEEKVDIWTKETQADVDKLVNYINKDSANCIATDDDPYGSIVLPEIDNPLSLTTYAIWPGMKCGSITNNKWGLNIPLINTTAGSKCPSPNQNCYYALLTLTNSGGNSTYSYVSSCSPYYIGSPEEYAKTCGYSNKRGSCKICANPPPQNCEDEWDVTSDEQICCKRGDNNTWFFK
jgi:hypothetical protein